MEQNQQVSELLEKESVEEMEADTASEVDLNNTLTEEEKKELHNELTKLEEEISTLKQVLATKEKRQTDLKQRLGMTTLTELKQNFSRSWNDVQSTPVFKKTSETLNTASQKTTAAFSNLGTAISRKFGDMRNSQGFKSFEETVETNVSNIKSKVGGRAGGGNFDDVLSSAAQASAQNDCPTTSSNNLRENDC